MRIITKLLKNEDSFSAPLSGVLYFDIETTGLYSQRDKIYLIGCASHEPGGWRLTQWFDDTGSEEKEIISSFLMYAAKYQTIVHFNGTRFDIPFLKTRIDIHGLENTIADTASLDLYKEIAPYKNILSLPDCRQQTVESFFGTGRTESESGRDLIPVYQSYLRNPLEPSLEMLLAHNEADIHGLISITPVLAFHDLASADLKVYKAQLNTYRDHNHEEKQELVLYFRSPKAIPLPVHTSRNGCHLSQTVGEGILKIPARQEEMKFYYAGYRDYYYLPKEDMAIHKSIASFTDSSHREQARAETCYTRKTALFLPQWTAFATPFYKKNYHDRDLYFELTTPMKKDRDFFSRYARYIYSCILGEKT